MATANISPGVYSTIIDLSTYVAEVPSTIGLVCALTQKGKDNQLTYISSRGDLITNWGEPNITYFGAAGKAVGQGEYMAYNFLGESGALYFMRCLPDDANFSHLIIDGTRAIGDDDYSIQLRYISPTQTLAQLKTALSIQSDTLAPLCALYAIGRGEYYNALAVRFTKYTNTMVQGVYIMDIYEVLSDGTESIVESFEVSFDPNAIDLSGESIWITSVLATYSNLLRAEMHLPGTQVDPEGDLTAGYYQMIKVYSSNIGRVTLDMLDDEASLTDDKQNFTNWSNPSETGACGYKVIVKDGFGRQAWGWLGATEGDGDIIHVWESRIIDSTSIAQSWAYIESGFDSTAGFLTFSIMQDDIDVATGFPGDDPKPLRNGSDGTIKRTDGSFDVDVCTDLLVDAFRGTLINPITGNAEESILDKENFYFNLVFDGGYPTEVKTQIVDLVTTRRDCMAVLDNGDNTTSNNAVITRTSINTYNTFYACLYEEYTKVYDSFSGQAIWFSPIYHMSYILPRNDVVSELWNAPAGYTRASINNIIEQRYNPKQAERDRMYIYQLNPIVKFSTGYVVWGQQTTQTKPSALQSINVVRLALYVKKALEDFCKYYIFEQNDYATWSAVSSEIVLFLENIKNRRGLYSYSVDVGATAYELRTKSFHVNVTLNPVRATEKIFVNLMIQ